MTDDAGERLNDENFRLAAESLRENESVWASQLEMMLGRPVQVRLDFDSLGGRYERVRPFIHQGVTGVLEAFGRLFVDRARWEPFLGSIRNVSIAAAAGAECKAMMNGETLAVHVPLVIEDVRAPTHQVVNAFRELNGMPVETEPEPAPEFDVLASPPFDGDPYAYATRFVADLEKAMRAAGLWPGPKPEREIVVDSAFGYKNMPFEHWLAWVFIPRLEDIVRTRDSFPGGSNVAGYAVRALDGANADDVIGVLSAFDDVINGLPQ